MQPTHHRRIDLSPPVRPGAALKAAAACGALALLASMWPAGPAQGAVVYGTNLVINGGAEADVGSPTGFTIVTPTGWSTTGSLTAVQYAAGGGFPEANTPGPAARGNNFFAGGPGDNNGISSASQTLSVADAAADIDAGIVSFLASGFFGGFSNQGDSATLNISFFDGASALLASVSLGGFDTAARGSVTSLLPDSEAGFIPAGTRSIGFDLVTTRRNGTYNDGYADNLSFVANVPTNNAVPAPATLALLAGPLVLALRRRRVG